MKNKNNKTRLTMILVALVMSLNCMAQTTVVTKKGSALPAAAAVDLNTKFVGVQNSGGTNTTELYTAQQLLDFIQDSITGGGSVPGGPSLSLQINDGSGHLTGSTDLTKSASIFNNGFYGNTFLIQDAGGLTSIERNTLFRVRDIAGDDHLSVDSATKQAYIGYTGANILMDGNTNTATVTGKLAAQSIDVTTILSFISAGSKINVTLGANRCVGNVSLTNGTVTVTNNQVTAQSQIIVWYRSGFALSLGGGNESTLLARTITPSTSFVINAYIGGVVNTNDNSQVTYLIIN